MASFITPPAQFATPQSVERKRRVAEALMQQGIDTSPVEHPFQALGRVGQALAGAVIGRKAEKAEQTGRSQANQRILTALQGDVGSMLPSDLAEMGSDPWAQDNPMLSVVMNQWAQSKKPKDPIKMGKDDVLIDPETYEPVYGTPADENAVDIGEAKTMLDMQEGSPGFKAYSIVAPTLQSMYGSLSDPSAMADLDFIYGVAKILDPTSVVREGEMGLVLEGQSLPGQIKGQLNRLLRGEQALTPEVRGDLYKVARRRGGELATQAQQEYGHYSGLGTRAGLADDILMPVPELSPEVGKWEDQNMQRPGGAGNIPPPTGDPISDARRAIQMGADPEAVKQRLIENGIDPAGL